MKVTWSGTSSAHNLTSEPIVISAKATSHTEHLLNKELEIALRKERLQGRGQATDHVARRLQRSLTVQGGFHQAEAAIDILVRMPDRKVGFGRNVHDVALAERAQDSC